MTFTCLTAKAAPKDTRLTTFMGGTLGAIIGGSTGLHITSDKFMNKLAQSTSGSIFTKLGNKPVAMGVIALALTAGLTGLGALAGHCIGEKVLEN